LLDFLEDFLERPDFFDRFLLLEEAVGWLDCCETAGWAALVFVILISGAGNDVSFYLLGLAAAMAGFEWMAIRFPKSAPTFRQAGAIFAVMATILPAPQQFLWGSMERMCAVLAGLLIGCGVAWGQNLTSFFDPPDPRDANPETKSAKPPRLKTIPNP
jgi:hypothetical protein